MRFRRQGRSVIGVLTLYHASGHRLRREPTEAQFLDAYDWLVTTAAKDGGDLTAVAAGILRQAHQREPG